jgi:hypothetical protein
MTLKILGRLAPALLALAACSAPALAQNYPGAAAQSPACVRLEGQLAALDRGGGDANADQVRRYEDASNRQQAELDRTVAQSRRIGCEGSGFFALFSGQPAQCGELNSRIQQMRANLDRILNDLQRLQGSSDRTGQRRALLTALGQNDCGPQYRTAAVQPRGFFDNLFGPSEGPGPDINPSEAPQSGTFRTLCVRTCDGFYYPISSSTVPNRFRDDERTCQRTCPAAEVALYSHRNPGEDVNQAVSINGTPYSQLPNAFRYRKELNAACSCKAAGQSWADALKQADDRSTLERGDVVVTEERAKAMAQPARDAQGRPVRPDPRAPVRAAEPATAAPAAAEEAETPPGKRTVRSVGPNFYPVR